MSEERAGQQQKMTVYLLGAVVVLLVAIIGIVVVQNRSASNLPPVAAEQQQPPAATPPAGMGAPVAADFDPKTATKVPKGTEPEAYVKTYFEAIVKGDYEKAYNMLPADKKAGQDANSFAAQLKSYGMNGFDMGASKTQGDEATVEATAKTPAGDFGYVWTFVKADGGWLVKSRTLAGMGGQ